MASQTLETLRPAIKSPSLRPTSAQFEMTSSESDRVTNFIFEAEIYLKYFFNSKSIQEIILLELNAGRRIDFILLKETLSKLYWDQHLTNEAKFKEFIESSEGAPATEARLMEPFAELELAQTPMLLSFGIPISLTAIAAFLLSRSEVFSFYVLFFPQIFLSLKGLLSMGAGQFVFRNLEPMSLHFSIFGVYHKLIAGKRTAILPNHFLVHFAITMILAILGLSYFGRSENLIFNRFGPLTIVLLLILQIAPTKNSDLSNLYFHVQNNLKNKLSGTSPQAQNEKLAKLVFILSAGAFTLLSLIFCTYSLTMSFQYFKAKNFQFLISQAFFDIAAIAVFLDLIDQFDQLASLQSWIHSKSLSSKLKRSTKTKTNFGPLIRAIPIFDGIPEEAIEQMCQNAKLMSLKSGMRIFRSADSSTELYVVTKGQVGIYKRLSTGKSQKIIDSPEGSIFGEGGFLLGRPRTGSAYCLKNSELLVIRRPSLFAATDRTQERNLSLFQKKIWGFQALVQSEFFKDLPTETVMKLITNGQVIELPAQNRVISQGDASDSIWVIIQGECDAIIEQKRVRKMKSKEVFGEIGVLWNSKRTSSVVTCGPSILLKIPAKHVWELLAQNLNVAMALQLIGEQRLKSTS